MHRRRRDRGRRGLRSQWLFEFRRCGPSLLRQLTLHGLQEVVTGDDECDHNARRRGKMPDGNATTTEQWQGLPIDTFHGSAGLTGTAHRRQSVTCIAVEKVISFPVEQSFDLPMSLFAIH